GSPLKEVGADENLLFKDHTHTFVKKRGRSPKALFLCLNIFSASRNLLMLLLQVLRLLTMLISFITLFVVSLMNLSRSLTLLNSSNRSRSSSVCVRSSLDTNVSSMVVNAPKGLFPPEPEHYRGPKLKVAIIGAGLAGMSKAFELLDQCHEVDIYESRPFIGGKVGTYVDKLGANENLLFKDHTHTFVKKGGNISEFDFQPQLEPIHGILAFLSTNQIKTYDKARNAVALALGPVVKALVDPDGALKDVRDLDSEIEANFGITNLLYTPDADFSCFGGLALTSPEDYYIEGQGSLL
ncbi:unnamed protein product, partial [Prunus brigantina]